MNCGKHRRPSIRRPTAARQRYEQSRLSEKAETARNGNFRPTIRRPTAKVGSKTATSRQNVAAAPKRSASTGCPAKNGFSRFRHTPATRAGKSRTLSAFSRKINFSPARSRQSMPPIPEEYKRLKGCGHNQRPDPSPHGGNASYESRIFAVHLSRLPIRRAADPIDSPHNCCRSHRSRHFPQAKRPLQSQRRKTRLQRPFWRRSDPNSPPKKGLKRESALQTRPPAANERTSNDGH